MPLLDFLGCTPEIKIIDFLAENMDMAYNQTEISKCVGISRTIVNQKIPSLIYNNIIEIKNSKGNAKKYGLKENSLVDNIISAIYNHSFIMSENKESECKVISDISKEDLGSDEECNCYCGEQDDIKVNFKLPEIFQYGETYENVIVKKNDDTDENEKEENKRQILLTSA